MSFENLTPDAFIGPIEESLDIRLTSLTMQLPSYINRVYELRSVDNQKLIVKFYRPDRWTRQAIEDEHRFIFDCHEAEVPVVPPLVQSNGTTLGLHSGILFAVFPKRAGRQFEINADADWLRIGSLLGRLHCVGARAKAPARITINPVLSTQHDVNFLHSTVIPDRFKDSFKSVATQIIQIAAPLFEQCEIIRIHGDCHAGNILDRMDEGLLAIDFDDMAMGPPVQDIWLLLPDRINSARNELNMLLEGYERFRKFNQATLRCIEPLRAMRMIYFVAWCSRQKNDFQFKRNFPDWGSDSFWQREIGDLREQLGFIMDSLEPQEYP